MTRVALSAASEIFACAAASGHGPAMVPRFSFLRHFTCSFRCFFLNLASCLAIADWQLTGSARTVAANGGMQNASSTAEQQTKANRNLVMRHLSLPGVRRRQGRNS